MGKILIPGVNLDVAGDDSADLAKNLRDARAGDPTPVVPNQILDPHLSSALGTTTNLSIVSQSLRMDGGETTGEQEIDMETSIDVQSVSGQLNLVARALKPTDTAIAANTIEFLGDLTLVTPAGTKLVVFREYTEFSTTKHQYLTSPDNNVAVLEVDSVSFDGMNGVSEVVVLNPLSLDITMGVSNVNYPTELRFGLLTVNIQAKDEAAGTYQDAKITDVVSTGTLMLNEILGDPSFIERGGTLTGSILRKNIKASPNGEYVLAAVLERQASDAGTYHFYYSTDGGDTFIKTTFTDNNGGNTGWINETSQYAYTAHPSIVVADNGKAFVAYQSWSAPTNYFMKGAYIDMTAVTPDMTPSAATGVDAENSIGTAGFLFVNTTNNRTGYVTGDTTDLSFVAFVGSRQNDTIHVRFFTNGGATYQGADLTGYTHTYDNRPMAVVVGSAGSHRTILAMRSSTSNLTFRYYDEPSSTSVGTFGSTTANLTVVDFAARGTKAYLFVINQGQDSPAFIEVNTSGSPTASALRNLSSASSFDMDDYFGLDDYQNSPANPYNWGNITGDRIVINPSDNNHIIMVGEIFGGDNIRKAAMMEVRDATAFQGAHTSQTTANSTGSIKISSSAEEITQVFTQGANRLRTFSILASMNGLVTSGEITAEIRTTSGGLPTTTVVATSPDSYDAKTISPFISNAVGMPLHFTFDTTALVDGTQYAFVLKSTSPISGTNYINIHRNLSGGYGGGSWGFKDNVGAWTMFPSEDLWFEINGEWIYDVSRASGSAVYGAEMWDQDTNMSLKDGGLQVISRRASSVSSLYRPITGHVFKADVVLGTGTTASTIAASEQSGYTNYDENTIFLVVPNVDESARKNTATGALSTTERMEDRSGWNVPATYTSITSADYVVDSDFLHGVAYEPQATTNYVFYNDLTIFRSISANRFVLEQEIKPINLTGEKTLFSHSIATALNTWWGYQCYINATTGTIGIRSGNGGSLTINTETSSGLTAGTYYRIRFVNDGTNVRIYYNLSKSGGSWVEFAYSTFNAISTFGYNTTALFSFSAHYDTNSSVAGPQSFVSTGIRYGYAKVIRGASTVASDGVDIAGQPPLIKSISFHDKIASEQGAGQNSTTLGTNFDEWGTIAPSAGANAFANTYEDQFYFRGSLGGRGKNPHIRLQFSRGGDDNDSSVRGVIARFKR